MFEESSIVRSTLREPVEASLLFSKRVRKVVIFIWMQKHGTMVAKSIQNESKSKLFYKKSLEF